MTFTEICSTSTFKNSNKGSLELIKNHPFLPAWPEAQHLTGSELTFTPSLALWLSLTMANVCVRLHNATSTIQGVTLALSGMNENDPMLAEQGEGGSQNL